MSRIPRASFALTVAGLLLATLATAARAEDDAVIADDDFVYCTVCHGIQVGGNQNLLAPRLSGLAGWYVERQLQAFRKGWRGAHEADDAGQEMRPMAAILSDDEIARAANYVDAVDSALPAVTLEGNAARGKRLYASCAACHGAAAEGNELLASPGLTGLNDWYLLTQLTNYKSGIRGSHPDDTFGLQMQAATGLLTDGKAMLDVIRYLSTLTNQQETSQ